MIKIFYFFLSLTIIGCKKENSTEQIEWIDISGSLDIPVILTPHPNTLIHKRNPASHCYHHYGPES